MKRRIITIKLTILRHYVLLLFTTILTCTTFTSCKKDDEDTKSQIVTSEAIIGKWELLNITENVLQVETNNMRKIKIENCEDREFYTFSNEGYKLEKFKSPLKLLNILPCKEQNFSGTYLIENNIINFDKGQNSERKLQISLESEILSLTFKRPPNKSERIEGKVSTAIFGALFYPFSKFLKPEFEKKEIVITKKYKKLAS